MLRALKSIPVVRQLGRWWVNRFLEGTVTPIRGGAQGLLWKRRRRYVNSFWMGDFEPKFQSMLSSLLKPGMSFYDVGANAGFYSLVAWKQIGTTGKCISVDPDPQNCDHMQELKKINRLDHWQIVEAAVAGSIGRLSFQTRSQGDPGGRLSNLEKFSGDNPQGQEYREVDATTFDQLVNQYGKPDVMKVDIEGAEWEAFRDGSSQLLSTMRPLLLLELHGNERAIRIQELFEQRGYRLLDLDGHPALFDHNDIFHVVAKPG